MLSTRNTMPSAVEMVTASLEGIGGFRGRPAVLPLGPGDIAGGTPDAAVGDSDEPSSRSAGKGEASDELIDGDCGKMSDGLPAAKEEELSDGELSDGGLSDGELSDGGLSDGELSDGELSDGDLSDGLAVGQEG
jgi:hypothetical protein